MTLDAGRFRRALGCFATGVAVITAEFDGAAHAMTANAISSLSLDPPLILFCPSKKARLSAGLNLIKEFSVNFLRNEQEALANYFAGAWRKPIAPTFRFVPGHCGPRLEGSLVTLECAMHEVIEGGDHWIVIGRVVHLHDGVEPHYPLVFFKGQYRDIDMRQGAPAPDLAAVEDEPPHIFYHN